MAYNTTIGNGIVLQSSDLTLTRGKKVRKHAVVEGPLGYSHIIENRYTGECQVYLNSKVVEQTRSLSAAYAVLVRLSEGAV